MSNKDIIELGSSDDEAEAPAPKKRKPIPNAMVHIPGRKLLKKGASTRLMPKFSAIQPSRRFPMVPYHNTNELSIKKNIQQTNKPMPIAIKKGLQVNPSTINKNTLTFNKNLAQKNYSVVPKTVPKTPEYLNKLPPGITVTKTGSKNISVPKIVNKRPISQATIPVQKKPKMPQVSNVFSLNCESTKLQSFVKIPPVTVELDDDEESTPAPSHQWYVKPEHQNCNTNTTMVNNVEEINNKEPIKNFVEITIEDSPVKPIKKQSEVGKELSITIDDSPNKLNKKNDPKKINSNEVKSSKTKQSPCSKKKLSYPENVMIEINIDGIQADTDLNPIRDVENNTSTIEINKTPTKEIEAEVILSNDVEVITLEDTPQKKEEENFAFKKITLPPLIQSVQSNTVVAKHSESETAEITVSETVSNTENKKNNESSLEFHPEYQKFIDLCFELENSDDMKKIVEKKIKSYYRQVPKEYTESEGFIEIVSSKVAAMKACPDNMYLHIKDVVDELNLQRKIAKAQLDTKEKEKETVTVEDGDPKRITQIRKLEKTLKKLHRAIERLEEQEVDFDDEADSVYLLTDRYKERLIKVHKKLCQLTNTKMPSEPRINIESRPGRPLGPARRLEKLINKKVPVGTPLPFPDFHDVVRCVREANSEDKLHWTDFDIMDEARDLFVRCGKKLKRRRQENEWRIASSRLVSEKDPVEDSPELKKKLEENKTAADRKESEVIDKYVDRQNQLKLEAVEINDKEADESPAESDDDVQEIPMTTNKSDQNSLTSKSPEGNVTHDLNVTSNVLPNKDNIDKDDTNTIKNKDNDKKDQEQENKEMEEKETEKKGMEEKVIEEKEIEEDAVFDLTKNKETIVDQNMADEDNINEISDDEGDELNLLEEIDIEIKSSSLESLSESDDECFDSVESADGTTENCNFSDVESIMLSSSDGESMNTSNETVKTVIEIKVPEKILPKINENANSVEEIESASTEDDLLNDETLNSPDFINLKDDSITIDEIIIAPNKTNESVESEDANRFISNLKDIETTIDKDSNLVTHIITIEKNSKGDSNVVLDKPICTADSSKMSSDLSVETRETADCDETISIDSEKMDYDGEKIDIESEKLNDDSNEMDIDTNIKIKTTIDHIKDICKAIVEDITSCDESEVINTTDNIKNDANGNDKKNNDESKKNNDSEKNNDDSEEKNDDSEKDLVDSDKINVDKMDIDRNNKLETTIDNIKDNSNGIVLDSKSCKENLEINTTDIIRNNENEDK